MSIMNKGKRTAAAVSVATAGVMAMSVAFIPTASAAPFSESGVPASLASAQWLCTNTMALRSSPGGLVVGTVFPGDNVEVLQRIGNWLYVHDYTTHMDGWISTAECQS